MLKWSVTKDKEADFLSVNYRRKSYSRPLSTGFFNDDYDFTKQENCLLNQQSRFSSLSNGDIHNDSISSIPSCEGTAVNMNFLDLNGIENLVSSKNSFGNRRRASTLCGGDLKAFSKGNTPKRKLSTPIMPIISIKHGVACPEICVEDSDECYYSENALSKEELIVCSSDNKLVYYRQKCDSPTTSSQLPDLEGPTFSINSDNLPSESNNQSKSSTQNLQHDINNSTKIVTPLNNDDLTEAYYSISKLNERNKTDDDAKSQNHSCITNDIKNDDTKKDDTEKDDTEKDDTKNDDTKNDDTKNDDTKNDDTKNDDTKKSDKKSDNTKNDYTKKEAAAALEASISNSENFIKKIKEEHLKEWKCNMILSHKYDEYIKYRMEENKLNSDIDPICKTHFELDGNKLMYKENLSIYILQL